MIARHGISAAGVLLGAAVVAGLFFPAGGPARAENGSGSLEESYRLQAANDLAGAIRAMRVVADAAPKAYFPRLRLAYLQLLAADYANSAETYRQASALAPNAVEPLLARQQALNAAGLFDQAEKVGREVVERDPKSYYGLSRLAWTLYNRKDYTAAVQYYVKVIELYPSDMDMRIGLGYSLLYAGKKSDAAAMFRDVLEMVPGHAAAKGGLQACR